MQILTKNQTEILDLFRKDIFLSKTIRGISIMLKKSYPKVHEAIKEMEKRDMLKIKKMGHSSICEIKLSDKSISTLSFLDEQEAIDKNIPNIKEILGFKEFLDDIVLVTGSYAKDKQIAKSDVDLVIITEKGAFNKQKLLENLTRLFIPEVHPIVIAYKDFIDMLLDKKQNYGKEIFKNRLLLRNSRRYYELIKEAIENGFKD